MNATCSKCGKRHGPLAACYSEMASAEHRMSDPGYGVPTGAVPRVRQSIPPATGYATTPHAPVDPIAELEAYLLTPEPPPGTMKGLDHFVYNPPLRRSAVARAAVLHRECATMPEAERCGQCKSDDHVQKAVDDHMLMERKARAWDAFVAKVSTLPRNATTEGTPLLDYLDTLLNQTLSRG